MKAVRILIVSLIAVFCVFLSACGCTNQEADDPIKDPITYETDAGTDKDKDNDKEKPDEGKDNESSTNSGSSSNSGTSSGSTTKPGSDSSSNANAPEKSDDGSNATPTPEIVEPEYTPTPPRRSSSSNLSVD